MKLGLVVYTCGHCHSTFEAPSLGEGAYGEFLLRSKEGGLAYLNVFLDPSYKDLDNILASIPMISYLSPSERVKVLRRLYGPLACDLDSNSYPFELDAFPACSECGSRDVVSWEFKNGAEMVEVPVQTLTHFHWSMLPHEDKIEMIKFQLEALGY
jgi:hypothetical protein